MYVVERAEGRSGGQARGRQPRAYLPTPLVILLGRVLVRAMRLLRPGGGTAVPGLVVNRLAPGLLTRTLERFPGGLVIVTGTAGKSTTTKMLCAMLRAHGMTVFTNDSTANISQGLMSALLSTIDLRGRVASDIAVLEVDEAHCARITERVAPATVVLTNVMTDQIDRFDEPERVADMLGEVASRATRNVVTNADDALLEERTAGLRARRVRYGVTTEVLRSSPRGLGYLQTSPTRLRGGIVVSEASGRWATVRFRGVASRIELPAPGIQYAVDAAAAFAAASAILGAAFDRSRVVSALGALRPVFGRGEVVTVRGHPVEFVLVQNPASFQLNLDALHLDGPARDRTGRDRHEGQRDQIMVAIGSDVRDPSYLWPVDTSSLRRVAMVSGSLAEETALQLLYRDVVVDRIGRDLATAVDEFLSLPAPARGTKTIVFSADCMRRVRSHLGLS